MLLDHLLFHAIPVPYMYRCCPPIAAQCGSMPTAWDKRQNAGSQKALDSLLLDSEPQWLQPLDHGYSIRDHFLAMETT